MLRQIARLGRNVPAAGERALAIAVYADSLDATVGAQDAGYEGVACVDDAARALELYCDLWDVTHLAWAMRWCEGLLDFILAMQDPDGRWVNFILDWGGTPNRTGRTSIAGGGFWQARALLALARAARTMPDPRIPVALQNGMAHVVMAAAVPADIRALHVITALALRAGTDHCSGADQLAAWSDEIVECHIGEVLMNSREERGAPHLWGHVQEAALADAGLALGRDDLVAVARRSAGLVFGKAIHTGFATQRTQPYDVASAVYVMSRLAEVTGDRLYTRLEADARAWFDGRNSSGRPVYDRTAGRVGDGVDGTSVNANSGAESNIVGAQALFSDVAAMAPTLSRRDALPASVN